MSQDCVKIDIIGGFLGAGKTTFLNKLLADGLKAERIAIIENEFGDEAVDDAVISGSGFDMRTLPSGCICCTLKSDFITSIREIVGQFKPDRILIEPTGLASPSELRATCELASELNTTPVEIRLNSITAIVDATDAGEMLDYDIPVYTHQIEQAHLIVLSHTQELDAEQLDEAKAALLKTAPPNTPIVDAPWDEIDALEILALSEQAYAESVTEPGNQRDVSADAVDHDEAAGHGHGHAHEHHHGHEGFASTVLAPDRVFDDDALDELARVLVESGALRAKGFLNAPNGGLLHYEYVNGRARVEQTDYDGPVKLVVIGRGLDIGKLDEYHD